jgi:hypothetical protein
MLVSKVLNTDLNSLHGNEYFSKSEIQFSRVCLNRDPFLNNFRVTLLPSPKTGRKKPNVRFLLGARSCAKCLE